MAGSKTPPKQPELWEEWLQLQQRLARRTSTYLQGLGELVGQGSLEPREYIERSAKMWAAVVGDVGDWLKPSSGERLDNEEALVSYVMGGIPRGGSRAIKVDVPLHLFHPQDQEVVVRLTTNGLFRRFDPNSLGRPALALEWERHLRFDFSGNESGSNTAGKRSAQGREGLDVRLERRTDVELKIYDLPDTINANEVYEGVVWGDVTNSDSANGKGAQRRVPVAVVALTIE